MDKDFSDIIKRLIERMPRESWKTMNAAKGFAVAKNVYYTVHDIMLLCLEITDEVYRAPTTLDTQREWFGRYKKKANNANLEEMNGDEWKVLIMLKTLTPTVQTEVLKGERPTLDQLEVRLDDIQIVQ
jgi:hypothetical protein